LRTSADSGGDGGDDKESIIFKGDGKGVEINFKSSCSRRLLQENNKNIILINN
jgi:hypothetical protein